jgi:transposase
MQKTRHKKDKWKRNKEVSIDWKLYDKSRLSECRRIIDLKQVFHELDRPVQRREFLLSHLVVLLLFKILFGLSYRGITNATKDLYIYQALGMKRAPCYKTIQNTMNHLQSMILAEINQQFLPGHTQLGGVDSSGMKTHRKGAWIQVRFQHYEQKKDFKKIHIFVDLLSKKIIYCLVTKGTASDHKQLKKILKECDWVRVDIILGDKGYDTRECFNEVTSHGSIPGIKVRKNASRKARGCPSRRRAVIAQQENMDDWMQKMKATMRCVVEAIFSGTKRRFGEYLFSIKARFRRVEVWLRTLLWNVLIYPR